MTFENGCINYCSYEAEGDILYSTASACIVTILKIFTLKLVYLL